jgi:2-keto-4-pentenoate hydratase/2-oxohepta-3-ene-1,7-dioic acid hydratase in catechol pathway
MTIWCVGRNYAEHAKELGNEVPKEPLFFIKSAGCLSLKNIVPYPKNVKSLHYELEMALAFNDQLEPIKIALALDLTDRVRQNEAKKEGSPWTLAKSFTGSCPISPWVSYTHGENYALELLINGQTKQKGTMNEMVYKPKELISYLKQHYPLVQDDLLLTGTPAGVGELKSGDQLTAFLKNSKNQILIEWTTKIE